MQGEVWRAVLLPFVGTVLGAADVFLLKKDIGATLRRALSGFAAGVMTAASVWSLLIPAIEQSSGMKKLSFLPAACGLAIGFCFLLLLDKIAQSLHVKENKSHELNGDLKRNSMLFLAVTLHNLPEGMAVGAAVAGFLSENSGITVSDVFAISVGIAIQNFPEGAVISMPLCGGGAKKTKAFLCGALSGIVEPIGALVTILAAELVVPALPYFLSFAAGAMLCVVVGDLIPDFSCAGDKRGSVFFAVGFSVMMILDVALG